jgi:ribosomal protein S18 acetylase RimI-like enzyme
VIREWRRVDNEGLRELWAEVGFSSVGDDDAGLLRMAHRNPGLLFVAVEGTRIVGSTLGAWDGRRGWLYHVATAPSHRRQGMATQLVRRAEAALKDLGCPKANVIVRDGQRGADAFWSALGYDPSKGRQRGRTLT